ncbi:nucleotide-diphospho-sugar transferase [Calycina marina]|uniref:glycogenin glucosyltransferase n=1 Tax=Calycina marina TaxID=1763456 RepID=A0A9P7Z7W2_9HELO|nr:nucleotide-diphospho-sugar transferase [Calycina marina]
MSSLAEDIYATLLLNDYYLPGALVLAHSLRDAGTTKRLAVLITDNVSADATAELQKIYDYIIKVENITNSQPANLNLMDRPELHSTFTKIVLWKQVQFRRIVYVDADIVALRAPDELFDLPHPFSAAPDIGWPDIFNTGLMMLIPNMGDYYALLAMAERGISFDGADQGLLNMHFKNTYNRLSFTYNVTPSAHYQYLPAFKHFQSSISMAHFIGKDKPWTQGREAAKGTTPYDQMVGRWWSVYDRHYRGSSAEAETTAPVIQYHTKGEYQPSIPSITVHAPSATETEVGQPKNDSEITHPEPAKSLGQTTQEGVEILHKEETYLPAVVPPPVVKDEHKPQYEAWDAQRAPPPSDSKPEAHSFPSTHYTMSSDPTPFKAPERYPDPPKDMYYDVPKTPTYQKPEPIFPWEKTVAKASRVFPEDNGRVFEVPEERRTSMSSSGSATVVDEKAPVTPTIPRIQIQPTDPWQTYTSRNAWDDIPEIERYIGNLQRNRKGNIQVLQGYNSPNQQVSSPSGRRHSMKLTDFPTEMERPSLPVTPAPIRRPTFWGKERDDDGELPAAEGVPSQEEWDPTERLEQLARRQSDVLANKLSIASGQAREIPMRPLPYGSEGVISPTYVPQTAPSSETKENYETQSTIAEPSYHGPSAQFEKDETFLTTAPTLPPSEEEKDVFGT